MPPHRLAKAAAIAALLMPVSAMASRPAPSPLRDYVHARAADVLGQADRAAAAYAALFTELPADKRMAARSFRQAIIAGDRKLAVSAARALDAANALPPEGRLLLIGEAAAVKDWRGARAGIVKLKGEDVFGFLGPILSAWITVGARDGDPLAPLSATAGGPLGSAYNAEHRALIALAIGKVDDGVAAIRALGAPGNGRSVRLRIAAAAQLQALKQPERAEGLLAGDEAALGLARTMLAAHKPLPGAVATPADGIAELLVRIGSDINRERISPLALALARTATFIAPDNAETWLVTSTMLAGAGAYEPALAALSHVGRDDPLIGAARDLNVQLLLRKGDKDAALAQALAATQASDADADDWSRAGDIYEALDRHADAAAAYGKALSMTADGNAKAAWTLWLQRGSALERAGNWGEAKPALQRAVQLAPDEAVALNYLGYAQLDRHENVVAATKLVERASALRPDDPAITDSLGWAYYLRGDLSRAIPTLEKAAAAEPSESDINEHLGDAYWAAGRRYEARYAWRAALVAADEKDMARIKGKIDTGPIARQ